MLKNKMSEINSTAFVCLDSHYLFIFIFNSFRCCCCWLWCNFCPHFSYHFSFSHCEVCIVIDGTSCWQYRPYERHIKFIYQISNAHERKKTMSMKTLMDNNDTKRQFWKYERRQRESEQWLKNGLWPQLKKTTVLNVRFAKENAK